MKRISAYTLLKTVVIFCLLFTTKLFAQVHKSGLKDINGRSEYNIEQKQTFPDFTYQDHKAKELRHIRKKYKLDSIAGRGNDLEKAKSLLRWFHDQVPHNDGINIPILNANTIIDSYKENQQSHGCYPLAIGMNDIFLAMGYKSRVVICFSGLYPHPQGGHVITTVYMPSLNKWLYMDPQDNAYVMDEHDNLLSIQEVRERLINGQPMKLNPDANYHDVPTKKEEYLDQFMAEHLFRVISPLHSEFNALTRQNGKTIEFVELLPVGSKDPYVDAFETQYDPETKRQVITYHTNNSDLFWKLPK